MADDLLEPTPPVGVARDLIRHRDKAHVGSFWLNRTVDYEFEDPATGPRHASPIARDVVLVVIRARGEEICRLRIPVAELMGETPYVPPATRRGGGEQGPTVQLRARGDPAATPRPLIAEESEADP